MYAYHINIHLNLTALLSAFPKQFYVTKRAPPKLYTTPRYPIHSRALPLQTPTLGNQYLLTWRPTRGPDALDGLDELLALNHFAKDGVLAIEMGGGDRGDEELGSVAARWLKSASPRTRIGKRI